MDVPESFKAAAIAADNSDWKTFVELMGGPFCYKKRSTYKTS